jgi:putative SOS response-associated peptidase YedK
VCSKYSRKNKKATVGKKEVPIPAELQPVIRPTDRASIIRAGSFDLEIAELRWGLIPSWAQDPKIGVQCINARSETVAEKPAFRDSFVRRRCLVPADSFFEWETRGGRKIPWRFEHPNHEPFCMAGLWDRWNSPEGPLETFTILTCPPNQLVGSVHSRMPVLLSPDQAEHWLSEGGTSLLIPAPNDFLIKLPVEPELPKDSLFKSEFS